MNFLKTTGWMLLGGFVGAWVVAYGIASQTFDVPTRFGTISCFKLDK